MTGVALWRPSWLGQRQYRVASCTKPLRETHSGDAAQYLHGPGFGHLEDAVLDGVDNQPVRAMHVGETRHEDDLDVSTKHFIRHRPAVLLARHHAGYCRNAGDRRPHAVHLALQAAGVGTAPL